MVQLTDLCLARNKVHAVRGPWLTIVVLRFTTTANGPAISVLGVTTACQFLFKSSISNFFYECDALKHNFLIKEFQLCACGVLG